MTTDSKRRHQPLQIVKKPNKDKEFFNMPTPGFFNIDCVDSKDVRVIVFSGWLAWNAFTILNARIYKEVRVRNVKKFRIDLSDAVKAYESGVLPLIAMLEKYRKEGIVFRVVLPRDHALRAIFNNHNWSHYLDNQYHKSRRSLNRTTGTVEFDNFEKLNELMRNALNLMIRAVSLAKGARESLEWSLAEITDNVIRHSLTGKGWFEVTWSINQKIVFTVCDNGVGIPRHMRDAFPEIKKDHIALAKAVEKGVTSSQEGQGNGLAGTLALVTAGGGELIIYSKAGHLRYNEAGLKYEPVNVPFPGTYVQFALPEMKEIDIKVALWGHESYTYAKFDFDPEDGESLTIILREEASSFGNRATGLKIRNLIVNLLTEFNGKKIYIDFDGVDIISSSFADELFGKFVLKWGVMNFGRHLGTRNTTAFIDSLINNVVMQRMAQAYAEGQLKPTPISDV